MTKPTSIEAQYQWHKNALLGHFAEDLPVETDPQPGFYKRRLVRGGPFVPCRIWIFSPVDENGDLVGDEKLQAECNGKFADPESQWEWLRSMPITEAEYNYLVAAIDWAKENAPDEPMANVREKTDWTKVAVPVFTSARGKQNDIE